MKKEFRIFAIFTVMTNSILLTAQQINRDVVVVKPYEPTLSDAYKISPLPRINDTSSISPSFHYSVLPVRMEVPFELKPIKAARMVGTPLEKLYNSYLRLGIGNYFTPVAEYNINSLRSKDKLIGGYFMHHSAGSKIKLDNGDDVPAGYSDNEAGVYAKKFYTHADLSGNFRFRSDVIHYYGYNTQLYPDTTLGIKAKNIKQRYTRAGVSVKYNSTYTDSSHLNFDLNAGYQSFNDKLANFENKLLLSAYLNKRFGEKLIGLDVDFTLLTTSVSIDSSGTSLIGASPYFSKKNEEYEFLVGGRIISAAGNQTGVFIFPRARLQFRIVDKILIPYIGIDGDASMNTYEKLSGENPYILPASSAEITDRLFVYAGVKGRFSSKSGFDLNVTYSIINNMPLFVNDSTGKYDNKFKVITDDAELLKYSGTAYFNPGDNLNLSLSGNLYAYKMSNEQKPWHKPDYDITFQTKYNLKQKIFADININLTGTRFAKPYDTLQSIIKLDPVFDINLGLEYRYSGLLSIFVDIYNLTAAKYYIWNQYPGRRLNIIAGFTYKL